MDGMLERMTWEQLCGWIAYHELDPFGEHRADLRAGIVASVIANANRNPKKTRAFKATDFMPKFDEAARETKRKAMTDADAWAAMVADKKNRVAQQARGSYREVH